MRTVVSLLTALSGLACAATPPNPEGAPEGLTTSEWGDIQTAYEAGRHAPQRQANGHLLSRNPGQQWRTEFDGKGFTVTPDHGEWTWGLDLNGYGDRTLSSAAQALHHDGGRITCQRDENLTEWFINDRRGLEQGWDLKRRPDRADPADPLLLHFSIRGNVRPEVSAAGDSVSFEKSCGASALNYGGLKAWDADGKKLPVRFEQADGNGIRIAVEDLGARYPITIDPVARQSRFRPEIGLQSGASGEVAISGDTAVLGGTRSNGVNDGTVSIFARSGMEWTRQPYVKASNVGTSDFFGTSVAISGDTLVVGAPGEDSAATGVNGDQADNTATNSGAVYIFTRSEGAWTQQAYLKASNTMANNEFGYSVSISGDTVVVGARSEGSVSTGVNGDQTNIPNNYCGAAYVFTRSGTTWTQQAYLKASNTDGQDRFGSVVAISGDTVVISAPEEDSSATGVDGNQASNAAASSGAAYIFHRSGTTWSQQAYLKASNTGSTDMFGSDVSISGDTVIIGAPSEDSVASGVDGNQADNTAGNAGAAYVFFRSGTTWTQQAYLKASNTQIHSQFGSLDFFGASVAIHGQTAVVGAYWEGSNATGLNGNQNNNNAPESGAAYLFVRTGATWAQQDYIKGMTTTTGDKLGSSVAISGESVVTTAPGSSYSTNGVSVYVTDYFSGPKLSVTGGPARSFGPVIIGSTTGFQSGVFNLGPEALILSGDPKIALTGSSDFSVVTQPTSPVAAGGGNSSFEVRFAPTSEGMKTATLSIASNNSGENPFLIHLNGTGWFIDTDTDGDGLNDMAEYSMAALGFDWQVNQASLVNTYFANASGAGLYTPAQIQALHPGTPLIARDPASGRVKLTTRWQRATDLTDFADFAAPAGSAASISPAGDVQFELPSPEDKAFFRIDQE